MEHKNLKVIDFYLQANIKLENGCLELNNKTISKFGVHYNISAYLDPYNHIVIYASKPKFAYNYCGDVDNVCDEDTETLRTIFGKPYRRAKDGYVELKERTPVTYFANNWIIIE